MTDKETRPMHSVELVTPLVPIHIKSVNGAAIDVAEIGASVLEQIGRAWTEQLLIRAAERRDATDD